MTKRTQYIFITLLSICHTSHYSTEFVAINESNAPVICQCESCGYRFTFRLSAIRVDPFGVNTSLPSVSER